MDLAIQTHSLLKSAHCHPISRVSTEGAHQSIESRNSGMYCNLLLCIFIFRCFRLGKGQAQFFLIVSGKMRTYVQKLTAIKKITSVLSNLYHNSLVLYSKGFGKW